jgi:hypothetical protein
MHRVFSLPGVGADLGRFVRFVWSAQFHQYQVVGRALPTPGDEHPKIYRMKLWATNEVRAKSKFWSVSCALMAMPSSFDCCFGVLFLKTACGLVRAQVLPEEAQEGEEEQWPGSRHQRGTTRLPLTGNAALLSEFMWIEWF